MRAPSLRDRLLAPGEAPKTLSGRRADLSPGMWGLTPMPTLEVAGFTALPGEKQPVCEIPLLSAGAKGYKCGWQDVGWVEFSAPRHLLPRGGL